MLILLSPAKALNYDSQDVCSKITQPIFKSEIADLVALMQQKSETDIKSLMGLSDKLAKLNYERYQNFSQQFNKDNSKQAIFAFNGDVYQGFDALSLSEDDILFAHEGLRILSGLYGVLRPLDAMQPYRLEMGTKLKGEYGEDLYDFWGSKITQEIDSDYIINLASNEYFSSVKKKELKGKLINVHFKEFREGKYKIIGIYAKKARGLMARFIVQNRIKSPEKIKEFNIERYQFAGDLSDDKNYVFVR